MKGGQEEKKPQKMVRSSIACARCRRSKVKCVNNGINSTCKACAASGRDCQYPPSGSAAAPRWSEAAANIKQEEGESKKRVRKVEDTGRRNSAKVEDPLEASVLTRKVWDELYDIFKLHFSTEMPFLHPPTFRNRMRQAAFPRDSSMLPSDFQDGRVLLLGVLTLTARFHPELVAYHSSPARPNSPLDAGEYYATALKNAFGPTGSNLTSPSIEGIQALLMLGLYEWGQTRGLSAWVYVGIAVRLAQSMGLAYEDDPENRTPKAALSRRNGPRENAIDKEVRRRTLWSCFVMDRMLSSGKYRPVMISTQQLLVRLPCSDDQFLFVRDVQTPFLFGRNDEASNDDGVLSWYIRLVEIFGRFSEWSCAGGRRTEGSTPPWDPSTRFYQLRRDLERFHEALPSNLTFTEANLSAFIEKRNATTYASMHTLYSLCLIMLHREYIPFIPLRCNEGPVGPLDEPTFPPDKFDAPPGFWVESAAAICKAAKDILDIVRTCQDCNALPESPQMGFAIFQAAFVSIYAMHFRQMDTRGSLQEDSSKVEDYRTRGYSGLAVRILGEISVKVKMAKGYVKTVGKMHDYFVNVKAEYERRYHDSQQKLRWSGGGLEQYKLLEKELKEFGSLQDPERNISSDGSDIAVDQVRSRASTNDLGQGSVNGEAMQGVEVVQTPRLGWAAINNSTAGSPPLECEDRKYPPAQGYPYQGNCQQSPGQNSNPPSLISPSNGESTPGGINSPYTQNPPPYRSSGQPPQQPIHAYGPSHHHGIPMAPPPQSGAQLWESQPNEAWMEYQENINMSTSGMDNFSQQQSEHPYGMADGLTYGYSDGRGPQSYEDALLQRYPGSHTTQAWG